MEAALSVFEPFETAPFDITTTATGNSVLSEIAPFGIVPFELFETAPFLNVLGASAQCLRLEDVLACCWI